MLKDEFSELQRQLTEKDKQISNLKKTEEALQVKYAKMYEEEI